MAAVDTPMTLDDALRLYEKPAYTQTKDQPETAADAISDQKNESQLARSRAILDTGFKVGVNAGLSWQIRNINKAVKKNERDLDSIYDFTYLMIQDRVVPPVITEAKDLYHQEGDYTLRLSGEYYKIEYQARFSSVAPNWREYLTFVQPTQNKAALMSGLKPKTPEEKKVWKLAVEDGWRQGVEQANLMLQNGLDRMNRDYTGMLRYHTFAATGKVSMPIIASDMMPINNYGRSMAVDEKLLRITVLPVFDADLSKWRAVIRTSGSADPVTLVPVPVEGK